MKKQWFKVFAGVISLALILTACGGGAKEEKKAAEGSQNEELPPVELVWNFPLSAIPQDLATVQEAVNKITKEKINATVKLQAYTFADYNQKMNTVVASGENYDIAWVANWNWDYLQNQSKGAFLELDDLIQKQAPDLMKSMPDFVWDAAKIQGKIYAIPNYQTVTKKEGFVIQKRFADKYKLDVNSIKKFEDIEPFLKQIKEGESADVVPFLNDKTGRFSVMYQSQGLEALNNVVGVELQNPDKPMNLFETPQYKHYLDVMRDWYTKGYINENAATLKNKNDIISTGNAAVQFHSVLKPGGEMEAKAANGGNDVIYVPLTDAYASTGTVITTMQAISKNSKNPERAMMFINLLNTDKDLYNTICYGVEGKHYTKVSDNVIKVNKDAGYVPNANWVFGNTFNAYLVEGMDPAVMDQTKKENETATKSALMGFKFDNTPVLAEIANIATVIDQYQPALDTGTVDPNTMLKEFQDKLKQAGIDKVTAEMAKQIEAWKQTK
ncbi:ABC transporter substrate-binding protein [Paenibacillus sp. KQZ6P-2]|uniref:ABC transporter substrate-binding protein n=1 Tax=Paenibacillus mangrovi TaxID=2931978 RepID=A0A9X1WQG4_9BACL|nr:ABC transporter substrate-binding protein [Paenibacillus mangrovi]MCJ8011803.1 ABC transporter substrate-binding protein [Paenibacillus mangrovi]